GDGRFAEVGPSDDSAVGISGICGSQNDGSWRLCRISPRAKKVDGNRRRELHGAEAGHKVTASNLSSLLHRLQHLVYGRKTAHDRLRGDCFTGYDAMTGEKLLRHGRRPLGA